MRRRAPAFFPECVEETEWDTSAEKGEAKVVGSLLDRDASLEAYALSGHAARTDAHAEALQALRQYKDAKEPLATTALNTAFAKFLRCETLVSADLDILPFFLDRGVNVRMKDDLPLQISLQKGNVIAATACLKRGADATTGFLTCAILSDNPHRAALVDLLIEHGANLDAMGPSSLTAAIQADVSGRSQLVKHLMERGAAKYAKDGRVLLSAVLGGGLECAEIATFLLDQGADVHYNEDEAICCAARAPYCRVELVQLLLERGANPNAQDGRPLRSAEIARDADVYRMLKRARDR